MKLHSIFWFLLFSDQLSHKKYNSQHGYIPPNPTWCLARVSKFCNSRSASGTAQDVDLEEWSPLYTSISWSDDGMMISTYPLVGSICNMYIYLYIHLHISSGWFWMNEFQNDFHKNSNPEMLSPRFWGIPDSKTTNQSISSWMGSNLILLELFSWNYLDPNYFNITNCTDH